MIFTIEPTIQPDEAAVFRRALSRFPDDYAVLVSRVPGRDMYTFWIKRGAYGYLATLRTDGGPLDQYQDEITEAGLRAMVAVQDIRQVNPGHATENRQESIEDYIKMRLDDFRRYLPESTIQEAFEKGQLPGLQEDLIDG